jgi:hypothetical protein
MYRTIILPAVLYRCEAWSVTREGHRRGVFQNRALSRIFGPKRDEVAEGWRRLHNEEFHNSNVSPNIIRVIRSRRMRMMGGCSKHERENKCVKNFGRKT